MENDNPLVSIVIVNYNGQNLLEKCLISINHSNYKNFEIILVDNNSSDDSINYVKNNFPKIKILELNKNFGFAIPNNMAAKIAKGKYIVFLNNDTNVTQNWLSELVYSLEKNKEISIGQSLLVLPDGNIDSSGDYIDEIGRAYSSSDRPQKIRNILSARAACMILRKDIFLDMGGFDESYFASFEDVEFGWRAWLWGYKVSLIPNSIVYHLGGKTTEKIPEVISFHGVKNNILLRLVNFDRKDSIKSFFWMISILFFKNFFGISIAKSRNSQYQIPKFKIILKAIYWILKNQSLISKKRHILRSRQLISNEKLRNMGLITPHKT
ncbi:MAG: glycosyltransferase family 2 protein [Nitrosopumilus sp.]|nr:glycosyltransferase family 2 protein [Nitrosopumilus sp.]